jgi:glycerate-2-kinase
MMRTAKDILRDRIAETVVAASGHPLPDHQSVQAGRAALAVAHRAGDRSLLLLLSGGASAMLCAPADGVTLEEKATATRTLMNAGIGIHDLNCVRKHLSAIKGGWLGAAVRSSLTLAISDVHHPIEDDPSTIASGPAVADPTTFADALEIATAAGPLPASVMHHLRSGAAGGVEETIKPGDRRLAGARVVVIGNRRTALAGAAACAESLGYAVTVFTEPTIGEADAAARAFVSRAQQSMTGGDRPVCVLAAGETTVTVTGQGRGGRNQQFALAAAGQLQQHGTAALVSAGTDGVDGPTPAAGAIVDSTTCDRAIGARLDRDRALADNDAYAFFERLGDLIVTGPTGTNVGDIQVLLAQ